MMRSCKRIAPLLGLLALLALLAGCAAQVQGSKFAAFKDSAETMNKGAEETYAGVQDLRARYVASMQAMHEGYPKNLQSYLDKDKKLSAVDKGMGEGIALQKMALAALAHYAEVLHRLATTDYTTDLDAATLKFDASLQKLVAQQSPDAVQPMQAPLGLFATAVRMAAKAGIELERGKRLRLCMDQAKPALLNIISPFAEVQEGIALFTDNSAKPLYTNLYTSRKPGADGKDRVVDAEVDALVSQYKAVKESLERLNTALSKIPAAHEELRRSLDDKATSLEGLTAFIAEVQGAMEFFKKTQKN